MSHYRTDEEVRRYDIFKGVITGILLIVLLIMAVAGGGDSAELETAYPGAEVADATEIEAEFPAEGEAAQFEELVGEGEAAEPEAYPAEEAVAPPEDAAETAALAAPDLLSPAPGSELATGPVTFSGMGAPGSMVAVLADGQELGRAEVDENGTWQLETELSDGDAQIELQTLDNDGNVAASSAPFPVTVSESGAAPEALAVDPLPQDLKAGTVTMAGSGEPGYQASVEVNGVQAGVANIDESGAWSVTVDLAEGSADITVKMLAPDGATVANISAGQYDLEPATPTTVNLPEDDQRAGTVTLDGTGEPGTNLRLLANGADIGTAVVGEDGTWNLEAVLPADDYEIDIAILDAVGNVLETIPAISLPVLALEAPTVEEPVLAMPDFNPLTGSLAWLGETDPSARVAAIVDDEVAAETTADDEGNWQLNLSLDPGQYNLSFGQVDEDGNVTVQSEAIAVNLDGRLPQIDLPQFSLPDDLFAELRLKAQELVDEAGQARIDAGEIAAPDLDAVALPEIRLPAGLFEWTGTAEPGSEVAVVINSQFAVTGTADEEGNFVLPVDLQAGIHNLQLALVGEDGALFAQSKSITTTVEEGEVPTVGAAEQTGDEAAVAISGTAEPGSTVAITANGEVIGETTADADGNWSIDVQPLPETVDIRAQTLDEDGNPVLLSEPVQLPGAGEAVVEGTEEAEELVAEEPVAEEPVTEEPVTEEPVTEEPVVEEPAVDIGDDAQSVVEATLEADSFSILLDGLEAAGLTNSLSDVEGAYTLFAPTDEAFETIPPGLIAGWNVNPEEYVTIISYLVVEGAFAPEDLTDGKVLQTLGGSNIGIRREGDQIYINNVPVIDAAPAGNSMVYALNQLLLPPLPAGISAPIIDESGVPTFTGPLLTVVGVAEPGYRILLTVNGESFGDIVMVAEDGTWIIDDEVAEGVQDIMAYMIDDLGLLRAVAQYVQLPVPESEE